MAQVPLLERLLDIYDEELKEALMEEFCFSREERIYHSWRVLTTLSYRVASVINCRSSFFILRVFGMAFGFFHWKVEI